MTRAISVLLGLGLLATTGVAADSPSTFQVYAAVQESLARVHPRMRASWLRERGVDDPYYTAVRMPDSGQGLREVGRWSYGPSYDVDGRVTPSETLVALAQGSGVSLLRFSRQDSLSIELLSDINAEALMCRVKVADTLLYVGSRKGLEIYNITDEQNPTRLSWTPIPLNDFALQDSLVYTISGDNSFRIYNVSIPASPVFRGACMDSGDVVSASGNAAFVGGRWGLYVIDVTNPTSPHRISSWGSDVIGVEARGDICCVTLGSPSQPTYIKFYILDARNPASLVPLGSIDSCGGYDFHLDDSFAFLSGYYTGGHEFRILSIRDSVHPYSLGGCVTPGDGFGVWSNRATGMAFVADNMRGLVLMDIDNLSNPTYDRMLLAAAYSEDVVVQGNLAYIGNQGFGLKILDISNPALPFEVGSLDSGYGMSTYSVAVQDSFAYMVWSPNRPWLRSIDATDPTAPQKAGGVSTFDFARDMVVRDSFLYLAEPYRFQIVNVARPRQPTLVGSCVLGDYSYGLDLDDSLAYVATYPFSIIDVKDPTNPVITGTTSRGAWNGTVRDTFLFLSSGGILAFCVADPSQPRLLDSLSVGPNTYWVEAVGNLLYTGNRDGVRVVDAADIHNMRVRGFCSTPYTVNRLTYRSPYIYAACWEAGVSIYESTQVAVSEGEKGGDVQEALSVRPNPATTSAVLSVFGESPATVTVRDIAGRVVRCATRRRVNGGVVLDLAKMPPGVYFAEGSNGTTSVRVKFVKR